MNRLPIDDCRLQISPVTGGGVVRRHRLSPLVTRYSLLITSLFLSGCAAQKTGVSGRPAEMVSKTYYLDGAGNYGFGTGSIPKGLKNAGQLGDFEVFMWTVSFNAIVDQRAGDLLKKRGEELARKIESYVREYPGRPVNIITLSAGAGVAAWAVEDLPDDVMIDNLVFLGCSLSHDYDLTPVLRHLRGKLYTFYSDHDGILPGVVGGFGTVDGKWGTECIGQVGADVPQDASAETQRLYSEKVVNNPWLSSYREYGYYGDHTGATNTAFVTNVIAPLLSDHDGPTAKFAQGDGMMENSAD